MLASFGLVENEQRTVDELPSYSDGGSNQRLTVNIYRHHMKRRISWLCGALIKL
jgi:hypothetical protein